jgi:hypothetical protein
MRMNRLLAVPLVLLAVALIVIGTLQYRWLGRVAEAERQQMHRNLEFAIERLEGEISEEIHAIFRAFLGPEHEDVRWLLDDWQRNAQHPNLVSAIYVADRDGDQWTVRQLDLRTQALIDGPLLRARAAAVCLDDVGQRGPDERFPPMFGVDPRAVHRADPPTADARPSIAGRGACFSSTSTAPPSARSSPRPRAISRRSSTSN